MGRSRRLGSQRAAGAAAVAAAGGFLVASGGGLLAFSGMDYTIYNPLIAVLSVAVFGASVLMLRNSGRLRSG